MTARRPPRAAVIARFIEVYPEGARDLFSTLPQDRKPTGIERLLFPIT
jgi:hypothetical protein